MTAVMAVMNGRDCRCFPGSISQVSLVTAVMAVMNGREVSLVTAVMAVMNDRDCRCLLESI